MKLQCVKFCALTALATFGFWGCGDDLAMSENAVQTFSTIESLTELCTDAIEGTMVFEKSTATMYVCADEEWVAMKNTDENPGEAYSKHVMVRFPVQTSKETNSENIYDEIWKNFKGGENAELIVMSLDENLTPNGKVFLQDLFATANKSFVTIEETNNKAVEYKIARLEGRIDMTDLTSPIVKLRVKLHLTNNVLGDDGKFGSNATDVIYNAYVDLSGESDTVVIDFLTDYKAARVKSLIADGKGKTDFVTASKQANQELADALYLEKDGEDVYPTFETYVPNEIGLAEHFNSIVWVMALIDQKDKTPGFNVTYNAYRDLFAEKGNFKTAVKTTYAGREQDMFFVDFIALLIDANFAQWICWQGGDSECDNNQWRGTNAVYYDVVQKGFVRTYGLSIDGLVPYAGYSDKLFKSDVEGGYFRYFTYDETSKIWWPLGLWASAVATLEKVKCDATTVGNTFLYSFEGLDDNAVCIYDGRDYTWIDTVNVCLGRNKGDRGSAVHRSVDDYGYYVYTIGDYECVEAECDLSASLSCDDVELVPVWESSSSDGSSSSSFEDQGGRTPDELANDPSSKLYLGTCDEANQGSEKPFNINNAELATTTGYETYVCDGSKWRLKTEADERYGTCTKSMMKDGVVKALPSQYMKCDYLDNENIYEWIAAEMRDNALGKACHYGNVDKKVVTESGYEYVCETVEDLDNWGNHIHKWRETTVDEYCVGDRVVSTKQKVADEELGELTFNEKCEFQSSVYVRNNTEEGTSEWISNWTFVGNNKTESGFVIFMDGYTDNEVYYCGDKCNTSSVDAVKERLAVTSSSSQQQKLLNIICNMGEYNRVSAGAYAIDTLAFEVEVQLSEAEIKKTYVASAKRNDWHVVTIEDVYGECNEDKMKNQSSLVVFDEKKYKCDCEYSAESEGFGVCNWKGGSEKEIELDKPCTSNLVMTNALSEDLKYTCVTIDDMNNDWTELDHDIYVNLWCEKNNAWNYVTENGQTENHCESSTDGDCAVCSGLPDDMTTYILTHNGTSSSTQTAETRLANDKTCSDNPKMIVTGLNNYIHAANSETVHDFVCKNGNLVEAKDEQDACNAAFEHSEICTYMKNKYMYNGTEWVLYVLRDYCDMYGVDVHYLYDPVTEDPQEKFDNENINMWYSWHCVDNYESIVSFCEGASGNMREDAEYGTVSDFVYKKANDDEWQIWTGDCH